VVAVVSKNLELVTVALIEGTIPAKTVDVSAGGSASGAPNAAHLLGLAPVVVWERVR